MAWQIAVAVDENINVGALLGWLPVWAWSTSQRKASADELRKLWGSCWDPEPALTLINTPIGNNPVEALIAEIPNIELHHYHMTAVRVFGIPDSPALRQGFDQFGYKFVNASDDHGILFSKPMSNLKEITELDLDATGWKVSDDVYDAFYKAVGAPSWHGRNFDALRDSIGTGAINKIEIPYRIIVRNLRAASQEVVDFLNVFASLIAEMNADGCPVEMRIER
jgi:RNAse (barnase) inhibitor barstar